MLKEMKNLFKYAKLGLFALLLNGQMPTMAQATQDNIKDLNNEFQKESHNGLKDILVNIDNNYAYLPNENIDIPVFFNLHPNCDIYYTWDGSNPTEKSQKVNKNDETSDDFERVKKYGTPFPFITIPKSDQDSLILKMVVIDNNGLKSDIIEGKVYIVPVDKILNAIKQNYETENKMLDVKAVEINKIAKNDVEKAKMAFDFIRDYMTYDYDAYKENNPYAITKYTDIFIPGKKFNRIKLTEMVPLDINGVPKFAQMDNPNGKHNGICDNYSQAFGYLGAKLRLKIIPVRGSVNGYQDSHQWNKIIIDSVAYNVDLIFNKFLVSDGELKDRQQEPEATWNVELYSQDYGFSGGFEANARKFKNIPATKSYVQNSVRTAITNDHDGKKVKKTKFKPGAEMSIPPEI